MASRRHGCLCKQVVFLYHTGRNHISKTLILLHFRWKQIVLGALFYQWCTRFPDKARKFIQGNMQKCIGNAMTKYDTQYLYIDSDFTTAV